MIGASFWIAWTRRVENDLAVPHLLDREADRLRVVPGPHEVAVERVDRPRPLSLLDRPEREAGRHDALGQHLTAEHTAVRHPLAAALEHPRLGGPDRGRGTLAGDSRHGDPRRAELSQGEHVDEVLDG